MASAEYSVLTPERVSLQYDIAGIGSRGAAALVDTAIQSVALIVVAVALSAGLAASSPFLSFGDGAVTLVFGLFALAVLVIADGYFMLFEILWNGQTPGKRMVGVRVIRESGYPMRPIDAVIRNLVRIVDWLPAGYGIGVLTMLLNKRSKRLGDFASGTIVVREGSPAEGSRAVGAMHMPAVAEPRGMQLSNMDATLVRDFLVRRQTMNPQARAQLAARLSAALVNRYSLTMDSDPEPFLERLSS
jgi:uncharacterized RDD family membrane protein YckC